jgi:hypothetical protein
MNRAAAAVVNANTISAVCMACSRNADCASSELHALRAEPCRHRERFGQGVRGRLSHRFGQQREMRLQQPAVLRGQHGTRHRDPDCRTYFACRVVDRRRHPLLLVGNGVATLRISTGIMSGASASAVCNGL